MPRPEDAARVKIDAALIAAGWLVQDRDTLNIDAGRGVAVRHFPLKRGHGEADYLLFVDGHAAGVVEAKREGTPLTGVEVQAEKYATGIPDHLDPPVKPLPFLYQSTGIETAFTNGLDPEPRSRTVFHFHKPQTLARWLEAESVGLIELAGLPDPRSQLPASFRRRLRTFPSIVDLRTNQHFTLKTNPLKRADLDEFVGCYKAGELPKRQATWSESNPTGRWRAYDYADLVQRDKCSLDIFWLKDESLEASENLPDPEVIAAEIVEDLRAALEQFEAVEGDLRGRAGA